MAEVNVQRRVELISNLELTVSACNCGIDIVDVATNNVDEILRPLATRLASGRVEKRELIAHAANDKTTRGNTSAVGELS